MIPILDENFDQRIYGLIAIGALKAMTEKLVEMESKNISSKDLMEKCVWPVLYEADARFAELKQGNCKTPLDNFDDFMGNIK